MEKSKTPPVSNPSKFSSAIFSVSLAVCFVALIHVEIEIRAHRQMLQILNQERADTHELQNIVVHQLALVYNFSIFSDFHVTCK